VPILTLDGVSTNIAVELPRNAGQAIYCLKHLEYDIIVD
jgi:hypothetical protein